MIGEAPQAVAEPARPRRPREGALPLIIALQPLALRAPQAARACGISARHWRRLRAEGRTPKPLKLGGIEVWPVAVLAEWLAQGAPPRWGQRVGSAGCGP